MFRLIFLIMAIVLIIEIAIFVWTAQLTSIWIVLIGVVLTGVVGIFLAKQQGILTLNKARQTIARREVPGEEIFDGIAILVGAILLFTPGFLTDLIGFLLLLPPTRKPIKLWAQAKVVQMIQKGTIHRVQIFRRF